MPQELLDRVHSDVLKLNRGLGYDFNTVSGTFSFGQQRSAYGNLGVEYGTFYGGNRTSTTFNSGRIMLTTQFSAEPSVTLNWIDLPQGSVFSRLLGSWVESLWRKSASKREVTFGGSRNRGWPLPGRTIINIQGVMSPWSPARCPARSPWPLQPPRGPVPVMSD